MSKMFDYICGKSRGPLALKEAELEHTAGYLGLEIAENEKLRAENERLRAALNELVTNGEWTEGEQRGDWKISPEVYETARDALNQQAKESVTK